MIDAMARHDQHQPQHQQQHHKQPRQGTAIQLVASSLLGLLLMGGAAQPDELANRLGPNRPPLGGSSWALVSLEHNGRTIRPHPQGEPITLQFDAASRHISGNGGCNAYGGNVRLTAETALFTGIQAGTRGCSQPVMAVERLFFEGLAQAAHWQRSAAQRLRISSRDGRLRLNFKALNESEQAGLTYRQGWQKTAFQDWRRRADARLH